MLDIEIDRLASGVREARRDVVSEQSIEAVQSVFQQASLADYVRPRLLSHAPRPPRDFLSGLRDFDLSERNTLPESERKVFDTKFYKAVDDAARQLDEVDGYDSLIARQFRSRARARKESELRDAHIIELTQFRNRNNRELSELLSGDSSALEGRHAREHNELLSRHIKETDELHMRHVNERAFDNSPAREDDARHRKTQRLNLEEIADAAARTTGSDG